jgi:hypothetical protein
MTLDAFLFLQRSDLTHFLRVADAYEGLPLLFIDPGLVEDAIQQGLSAKPLDYRPLNVGRHLQSRITAEALARASLLDQLLCAERQRLFGDGVFQGWDQGTLRLFFIRALTARYLGEICNTAFPEARIGLFRPSRPQQFYFDSFVSTDLFTATAEPGRWRIVDHYDDSANWVEGANAACFDFAAIQRRVAAGTAHAVTHIPTCYSHFRHYADEIVRAFPSNIDLPSAFWDIAVRREQPFTLPLEGTASEWLDDSRGVYRERARQILTQQLAGLIPHRQALATQVDWLADRCHLQAVNYHGLSRALQGARPHFVITDHDTGNNGPLFSVAARLGAQVTVLPHSSYPTGCIPHSLNVSVVDRDGFQTPARTVWGEPVAMRPARLGRPAQRPGGLPRPQIKTVCLLLNTLYSQGLSYIDLMALATFHQALRPLCEAHGARLMVRLKPNGAGVMMAAGALGLAQDVLDTVLRAPIEEVAELTDLCISYGEPTSAGIEFLDRGSYLMHVGDQLWPSDYTTSPAYITDHTVPSFSGTEGLAEVRALLADAGHFQRRLQAQCQRFAQRQVAADGRLFGPATAPPSARH